LALAGVGPELTRVEIWADPTVTRNIHKVEVDGQAARLTVIVENVQSDTNPKTSRLAALSILACLKSLGGALRVGS
jgi:aspartate dehydrogenase